MLDPLAQAERPPVQGEPVLAVRCGDEKLREARHRGPGALPAERVVGRNVPPAQHGQPFLRGQVCDSRLDPGALGGVGGQEGQPGSVAARGGEGKVTCGAEQCVRDLGQDAGPVAGVRVAALGAPVIQVPQHRERLRHGVVGPPPGQVSNKPNATSVVFELAVVQAFSSTARGVSRAPGGSGGSLSRANTAGISEATRRVASRISGHGSPCVVSSGSCGSGRHWPCRGWPLLRALVSAPRVTSRLSHLRVPPR